MDSFTRIMLHEFTHYSSVGPKSEVGSQIVDSLNSDGEVAYQADRAHALKKEKASQVTGNADNYARLATMRIFPFNHTVLQKIEELMRIPGCIF